MTVRILYAMVLTLVTFEILKRSVCPIIHHTSRTSFCRYLGKKDAAWGEATYTGMLRQMGMKTVSILQISGQDFADIWTRFLGPILKLSNQLRTATQDCRLFWYPFVAAYQYKWPLLMPHVFAKPGATPVGLYSWQILKTLALISNLLFSAAFVTFLPVGLRFSGGKG